MSKKREIRATYAVERQGIGPTKWGCLPLLVLFWVLHLVFLFGEFLLRIWKGIKQRLAYWGLSYLLWSPVYKRINRSWFGLSVLVKFGLGYFAEEPEKVLNCFYIALNFKRDR